MVDVEPEALIAALRAAGWTPAGGRAGHYERLNWPVPPGPRQPTIVPLNSAMADYTELLDATLSQLRRYAHVGKLAQRVLDDVQSPPDLSRGGGTP